MGREIVYCSGCAIRLTGADFDKGGATRSAHQFFCFSCAPEGVMDKTTSRSLAAVVPARQSGPSTPVIRSAFPRKASVVVAGVGIPLVILGAMTFLGGRPRLPAADDRNPSAEAAKVLGSSAHENAVAAKETGGMDGREESARRGLEDAREYRRSHPEDLSGQIDRLTGVALSWDGSAASGAALSEAKEIRTRLQISIDQELASTDREVDALVEHEAFGKAFALLTLTKTQHRYPAWSFEVDRRIQRAEARGLDLLATLSQQARKAREQGSEEDVARLRTRVAGWSWSRSLVQFDRSVPSPSSTPPTALPADLRAYFEQKDLAWVEAGWGEFGAAEHRIREAMRRLREDQRMSQANRDLQDILAMAQLHRDVDGLLSGCSRGERLEVFGVADSAHPGPIEDPVYQAFPEGLQFKKAGVSHPYFVSFGELQWTSRLNAARSRNKSKPPFDDRASALSCLVAGDAISAQSLSSKLAKPLTARALAFGKGALPLSEGSASSLARHERAACRMFYDAEWEFRFLSSHAGAVQKYRDLREDFASTTIFQQNKEMIGRRSDSDPELFLRADNFRGRGSFELVTFEPRKDGLSSSWISKEDVDADDGPNNYVELQFSALPDMRYRCWAYVGGCCMESFSSYFQSSGYTTVNPETKQTISLEPGGRFALPLKPGIFLRSTHAAHARRGEPKKPSRWVWVEIPLAEYASGGLKKVRLISDQMGFAVAFAVISSTREAPPTAAETRAFNEFEAATAPAGSPEPSEWLLLGPFQNRGFGSTEAPEEDIVLSDPVLTKVGMKNWTLELAELRPAGTSKAAVFDFTRLFQPVEDVVAYAMLQVWAPRNIDVSLLMGSDDGAKMWINGALAHQLDRGRAMTLDEDRMEARLRAGWNRILIKVYQGKGGWGLGFRLTDREGKDIRDLVYDAFGNLPGLARIP